MIKRIDHLVLTTACMAETVAFYEKLGFKSADKGNHFELYGDSFKINLHYKGKELSPAAEHISLGSGDLCFEVDGDLEQLKIELESKGLTVILGVVERNGFLGKMSSIYLRDPEGSLIEFCRYQ